MGNVMNGTVPGKCIINSFRDEYFFLSNFYLANVTHDGISYGSNEAAFQACKVVDPKDRKEFAFLNPSEAKRKGRHVRLRGDWEQVKEQIMYDIVLCKFTQNPDLKAKLLATGDAYLEEGNTWGDRTWGTVDGQGKNLLGKILMEVRQVLRNREAGHAACSNKELVVLERSNTWYGGYVMRNGRYEQVFNSHPSCLFASIKSYTDKGYTVKCLDSSMEEEFMKGRESLKDFCEGCIASNDTVTIWRYTSTSPFSMGPKKTYPIATQIKLADYDQCTLSGGFKAVVVHQGMAKGVYEMESGGLVGDTVAMVNADIEASGDMDMMKEQVRKASELRETAQMVSNEEFGLPVKEA